MRLGYERPSGLPVDLGVKTILSTLDRVAVALPQLRADRAWLARRAMDLCRDSMAVFASVVKGGAAAAQLAERHARSASEFARLLKGGGQLS